MKKRLVMIMVALIMAVTLAVPLAGCGGGKITIYVDGGGQQGAYNSTPSMTYDKDANPYPYNTLEKLAKEYNAQHSDVEIVINKQTLNNDRERLVAQLTQKKAPDILFYLPAGITEDMNKGWFVDLDSYLNQPNPYCETGADGSAQWRDLYNEDELKGFYAPNGMIFTAPVDKAPIGIMYNKALFEAAGITKVPEYYSELMQAQDKLKAYFNTLEGGEAMTPYFPLYYWYDIVLESSIYSNILDKVDALRPDGRADAEEILRAASKTGEDGNPLFWIWNDKTDTYNESMTGFLESVLELSKYYPAGYEGYWAESEFVKGQVGMIEANSGQMMKISNDEAKKFEVGTFPYPKLDKTLTINGKTYEVNPGEYYTRRGLAGLTTGWGVTNSAINKGDKAVAAAVDFLMYVTAPKNNDRMVNDLGFSVPLSGNSTNPLYADLVKNYDEDLQNEKSTVWGAFNSWGSLGKSYMDAYLNNRKVLIGKQFTDVDFAANREGYVKDMLKEMQKSFYNAKLKLMRENNFDETKW